MVGQTAHDAEPRRLNEPKDSGLANPSQATVCDDSPATLPARADVAVVGAGAIGLAVAYELSLRGAEVVVIERGRAGDGTSSGNAGFVAASHVLPVAEPSMFATALRGMVSGSGGVTAKASLRLAYLRWLGRFLWHCRAAAVEAAAPVLAELGQLSAGLYQQWLAAERIDCCYAPTGLLNVYGDERAFAKGRQRAEWEARFGVRSRTLTPGQAQEREPALNDSVAGAVFYPGDAGLDPGRFVLGLAAVLKRRGVRLAGATEVQDVQVRSGRVRCLATSRGNVHAQEVVLAAGCWTPALGARCGVRVPIQPAKGYSLTMPMPPQGPRCRMLLGEKHVAVAPMGDRLRLSGWFELGRFDGALPPARLAQVEAAARSRLRLPRELANAQAWAGFRPVTPDGLPIVGRSSVGNLAFACGHAMLGMTMAPATGRLTAQTLCGQPPDLDIRPLSPARFQ